MSNPKVLEKAAEGKGVSKDDILYLAQRDGVAGVPSIEDAVDLDAVGGVEALQDALYHGTDLETQTKKQKGKKSKEPTKAQVEKAAEKSKVSPDPDDDQGYATEGSRGGAKVAEAKPAQADEDDDD